MAELKGPFFFTGSIGNIRAYYNRTLKRYILSLKGGSTKELIENNPAFARQLENMSEFKACAIWASQLRKSLVSIGHLHQGYYFSDIVAMGKSIQKHDDDHLKGKRSLESSKDARLLTTLNFNQFHPFDQVLTHQYDILFSEDKKTVTLKMSGFKSFSRINWPTRVDSYRIALVIAQLPDIVWGDEENRYLPFTPNMERLSVSAFSEWRQSSTDLIDIILTASFAQPALQQPGTTVVVALGIEISTAGAISSPNALSGYGSMKIVECFV
jgi:hypothetical protein